MALVLKNRVKVTSTTTGTGTFTLGSAVAGYQSFDAIGTNVFWNVENFTYSGVSFSVGGQDPTPYGLFFKPDGTKMYMLGASNDSVFEYSLSTAWDISTASYVQSFSVTTQDTNPTGLFFKPDGTKMYVLGGSGDDVNEYDLSTAWDISTASYLQNFSVAAQESAPEGLFFKPDGTKMYVLGGSGDDVNEYDLSTPWDISTAVYLQNFSVVGQEVGPSDLFFKPDGTEMYVVGNITNDAIYQYELATPWDISTASYVGKLDLLGFPEAVFFRPDGGGQFWTLSSSPDNVYFYYAQLETYYVITDGTDWEVGIGTYYAPSLDRTQVLGSSNSGALVNWGAGDKDVLCGYPSIATSGGVPYCDDSEIGTDLAGWSAFQAALQSGVTGGVTYDNNDTNGVVSTYSLVYTALNNYAGGVLAPNGDVHFVPYSADVGQKISAAGVVSTYSLVYDISNAYRGGVLAPNGDIYFVPSSANRGQKISANGVVSTYSLVYTANGAYAGGVLTPNGDIHFVPGSAAVGQKVSAAGVVSTYSLVYTTSNAYQGGVLAPNGDICFVPFVAPVGQKISAAGVVSTYSLVYTTSDAYRGGVLAPNGDIHFVPVSAAVGQKISVAGVVSTYSLVYTGTSAYAGGVLAPNGDIHFVPINANRGQKISASGVVSTYSLVYTTTSAYQGAVLDPNGNINFIPFSAVRGQKISTNPGQPLGLGVCLSSFLNKF